MTAPEIRCKPRWMYPYYTQQLLEILRANMRLSFPFGLMVQTDHNWGNPERFA